VAFNLKTAKALELLLQEATRDEDSSSIALFFEKNEVGPELTEVWILFFEVV
jgi:hypothetical protein